MKESTVVSTLSWWYGRARSSMGEHILLAFAVFLLPLLLVLGAWAYSLKPLLSSSLPRTQEQSDLRVPEEAFLRVRAELFKAEQNARAPSSAPAREIFQKQ